MDGFAVLSCFQEPTFFLVSALLLRHQKKGGLLECWW
jgi:hypothetical protein